MRKQTGSCWGDKQVERRDKRTGKQTVRCKHINCSHAASWAHFFSSNSIWTRDKWSHTPASEVTIICLPAWPWYLVSLQVKTQLLPSKHDWTKSAAAPGPAICCLLAAGCEHGWKNGSRLHVARRQFPCPRLMHVCTFRRQQTSISAQRLRKHARRLPEIWQTKNYARTNTHTRRQSRARAGNSGLKTAIWREKCSGPETLFNIRPNTYGMCFHPNSAGCPITWECLSLDSAELSTSEK